MKFLRLILPGLFPAIAFSQIPVATHSAKIEMKILLVVLFFLIPFQGLSQNPDTAYSQFALGNLRQQRVSLRAFAAQHTLNYPANFSLDSANIFFFLPVSHGVKLLSFYPQLDSIEYRLYTNKLTVGSSVSIDFYLHDKFSNKSSKQTIHYIISTPDSSPPSILENEAWKKLKERTYIEGTIYFSNPPMHEVITYSIKTGNPQELNRILGMLKPGCMVVFDKVTFKDQFGKTGFLNESIKIE